MKPRADDSLSARVAVLEVRLSVLAWTLPFAVALGVSLGLPWASCDACGPAGAVPYTGWSLPDSDVIGVSAGAEYGLTTLGGLLAVLLAIVVLVTGRPVPALIAAAIAAATTLLAGYSVSTVLRHGLDLQAGLPVTVCCAAGLTATLVFTRARLVTGAR